MSTLSLATTCLSPPDFPLVRVRHAAVSPSRQHHGNVFTSSASLLPASSRIGPPTHGACPGPPSSDPSFTHTLRKCLFSHDTSWPDHSPPPGSSIISVSLPIPLDGVLPCGQSATVRDTQRPSLPLSSAAMTPDQVPSEPCRSKQNVTPCAPSPSLGAASYGEYSSGPQRTPQACRPHYALQRRTLSANPKETALPSTFISDCNALEASITRLIQHVQYEKSLP
jgi:hypothetical protein